MVRKDLIIGRLVVLQTKNAGWKPALPRPGYLQTHDITEITFRQDGLWIRIGGVSAAGSLASIFCGWIGSEWVLVVVSWVDGVSTSRDLGNDRGYRVVTL